MYFRLRSRCPGRAIYSGLIVGFLFAIVFRKSVAKPVKYEWERADYNEDDDPFLKHFDENGNFIEHIEEAEDPEPETDKQSPKRTIRITYHFKKKDKD